MTYKNILKTYPNGMNMEQTETFLEISRQSIRNATFSQRLHRKRVGGNKFIYETKDVIALKKVIDKNLIKPKEVKEILADNGLADKFQYFDDLGGGKKKCKYKRVFDEFPLSPKQLHKRGFITADADIKPVMYEKSSLSGAIKSLTKKRNLTANNTDFSKKKSA